MIDTQAIKSKILDLAMRGQLTEQLPEDGTAEELYQQILEEKQKLIKDGKIKKEKPFSLSPVFEPYPFDIPDNWKFVRFGELMINRDSERIPVSVADRRKKKKIYDYYGASGVIDSIDDYLFDEELLLIGEDGANLLARTRPIAFIAKGKYWVNNHAHVLDICCDVDLEYICYYINSISLQPYVTGMAQPKMNQENMNAIWIPLSPVAEQKRIVKKIEQAFSILDTIDELQAQYADNLTALKSKLIDAAIQGKLTEQLPEDGTAEEDLKEIEEKKMEIESSGVLKGRKKKKVLPLLNVNFPFEIPSSWKWIRLNSVVEIFGRIGFRGYTKNDIVERGQGAISLSPSNITKSGKITYENCTFLSWDKYNESPEIMVEKDDVILVKTGSSYGKCAIVKSLPEKATINPQLAILKYVLCDRNYLHTVLISDMAHKQYEEFVIGAATPTFSQENLANFLLPLPPLAEQKRIVQKLDEILPLCEKQRNR